MIQTLLVTKGNDLYRARVRRLGALGDLRPRVNLSARVQAEPGRSWGPRTVSDSQLIFVLSGKLWVRLGSKEFTARRGHCVFYGPDSPHWIVASEPEPCAFVYIHFDWDAWSRRPIHPYWGVHECSFDELDQEPVAHLLTVEGQEIAFPHFISAPSLEPVFVDVAREFRQQALGNDVVLSSLLVQIIVKILRRSLESPLSVVAREKVRQAVAAIQEFPSKRWRVPELARLCGYHPTYFAELFREATGLTPKEFLIKERIRLAQDLLLQPGTLKEVAERCGFSSVHYFCRTFKAVTGLTPTEYRHSRVH